MATQSTIDKQFKHLNPHPIPAISRKDGKPCSFRNGKPATYNGQVISRFQKKSILKGKS